MNLDAVFAKFDLITDTPGSNGAIREVILQLAVRGHLATQSDEEAVSEQLARAQAFRMRLGRSQTVQTEKAPFQIPDNWGWMGVGDTMEMFNGKAFRPEDWSSEGIPIIRIQNLNSENAPFNRCKSDVDPKVHVVDGDFLISWSGTPGTSFGAFIWNRGFAYLNQHIFRCELVDGVFAKEFLRLAVNARLDEMISHAQGAVGLRHITKGKLESIRLPLPPLAEQARIVAKVDELMSLCDRLESQQQERETRQIELARASLSRFAEAPTPTNLNFLFHKSYDIAPADLRKAILSLAIHGSLASTFRLDGRSAGFLGDVIELISGQHLLADEQNEEGRGIPYLTGPADFGPEHPVPSRWTEQAKVIAEPGDILITVKGSGCGKTNILADQPSAISRQLMAVRVTGADRDYVHLVLKQAAEHFQRARTGIAIPGLSRDDVLSLQVLLPAVEEQRRIVAKVRALMTLTDQLETQISASREVGANLLDAVVAELAA